MKFYCENPESVAKEMFWLAWKACGGPLGMGYLQDNPQATKDDIWESVTGKTLTDYSRSRTDDSKKPYGDYVFGRMMKMGLTINSDHLDLRDGNLNREYQAWCTVYPTYEDLVRKAYENEKENG